MSFSKYNTKRFEKDPPLKEGEIREMEIIGVGEKGDGIAKIEGFVVIVPGTKSGDKVQVKITAVRGKVSFGEVVGDSESTEAPAEAADEEVSEEGATEEATEEEAPAEEDAEETEADSEEAEKSEDSKDESEEASEDEPAKEEATEESEKAEATETEEEKTE